MSTDIGDQRWYFSQVKGSSEDEVADADVISCVEFNRDGELLATGDKGGRVVVFKREEQSKSSDKLAEYDVYATFQSHEPEFDYLKSIEIEEKINKIQWLKHSNPGHVHLLSTNDKTIKLWRVAERYRELEGGANLQDGYGQTRDPQSITSLSLPRFQDLSSASVRPCARKVFANAHAYHINSISVNSDQETFISADDLRINLWHLDITNQSFNIVDIKPANMEELTEVITSACFHPTECNTLVYGSSKGTLRLCDLRSQALCDQHVKLYQDVAEENSSFFTEIISSISDIKFSSDGQRVVTRDYLTVKVWDLRKETRPVETYQVHDYLRSKMCALYENDCIFDKFEASWSHNDRCLLTGSYHNFFHIFDRSTEKNLTFEATRELQQPEQGDQEVDQRPPEKRQPLEEQRADRNFRVPADRATPLKPKRVYVNASNVGKRKRSDVPVDSLDFSKKVLHSAWHPRESVVAVAATSSLFIFSAK